MAIVYGPDVLEARLSLDSAMKHATSSGLSLNKKVARAIPKEMEEKLFERGYLGADNPKKLSRTLVYLISLLCGLRGGQELRQLKWGEESQLNLKTLTDGSEVLDFNEDISKTYEGGLHDHHVEPKHAMAYPNPLGERCIVQLFKKYTSLRPSLDTTGAFFLQARTKYTPTCWYLNNAIGHNTIASMIKNMMEAAGEDDNDTNQSGRKTTITRIMEATGNKEMAKEVTGHRSECVLSYNQYSNEIFKTTSNILSNSSSEPKSSKASEPQLPIISSSFRQGGKNLKITCPGGVLIELNL